MRELTCSIALPKTVQELDLAIQRYKSSDLKGDDLLCLWQAIRDAALLLSLPEEGDLVPGADSY